MEEVFLSYLVHLGGWAPGPRPALLPPCPVMRPNCILKGYGPSWNLLPQRGLLLGEGCLPVAKVPGFRPLAVATAMLYSLFLVPSLSLLVMPVPSHAWSRPLWYQVGLDLQPWGCQPDGLDGCRSSLGCPGYWMALGGSRIYPVAGITITTTMMLVIGHKMLQRWRSQVIKDQVRTAPSVPYNPCFCSHPMGPCPPINLT